MRCEVDGTAPGLLWAGIFGKVEEMQLKGLSVRLSKMHRRSVAFERFKARHHLLDTEMASLVGNGVGRVRGCGAIFQGDNGFLQRLAGVETHDGTRYGGKRQPAIWSCGRTVQLSGIETERMKAADRGAGKEFAWLPSANRCGMQRFIQDKRGAIAGQHAVSDHPDPVQCGT